MFINVRVVKCSGLIHRWHEAYTMVSYSKGDKTIYFMNGRPSTKEELNNTFLSFTRDKNFKKDINDYTMSLEQIKEELMEGYDYYTNYIDNAKQQQKAERKNKRIMEEIKAVEKL